MICKLKVEAVEREGTCVRATVFMGETEATLMNCGVLTLRLGAYQLLGAALGLGAQETMGRLSFVSEDDVFVAWVKRCASEAS
jgi:hypothetical protein